MVGTWETTPDVHGFLIFTSYSRMALIATILSSLGKSTLHNFRFHHPISDKENFLCLAILSVGQFSLASWD